MKTLIKFEEAALFALAIWLFSQLDVSLWWALLMLLAPDIGMLGYLFNTQVGAISYNLLHHKGIAIGLYLLGILVMSPILQMIGLIMFGHSSLDRVFGYGLKFKDAFQHTHLGWIGKSRAQS
ncbi:MAG: DUF4260 domain-containing protein [Anaerolineales bacterium]|jgi:hypothetical protein